MSRLVLTQITIKKERSISSTTWYYLLQPSNASAPDPTNYGNPPPTYTDTGYSGWSTTEPTYTVGDNRVLYIMMQTLYSDNTFSYATPTISSSYEAAKAAYNETLQAEADIEDLQELGLHHGYIWYNSTARPASGGIPVYPVGSYIASGINNTINQTNSNTYGLNTWISTGGINLRYNAINLAKLTTSTLEFYYPSTSSQGTAAISLGTHDGINSLIFYGFGSINKQMELTATALNFYGSSQSNADVTLNSNGLNITKGSITLGGGSFVVTNNGAITATSGTIGGWHLGNNYLSTSTIGGTPGSGVITLSQGIAGPTSDSGVLPANQTWAFTASNQFGVTTTGILYASGATIAGNTIITGNTNIASSVTIGGKAQSEYLNINNNLIWDTEWRNISNAWSDWGSPTTREIVTLNGKKWLHLVTTTTAFQGYSQNSAKRAGYGEVKAGETVVASFTAYAAVEGQRGCIGIHWLNSSGSIEAQSWANFNLETTSKRYISDVFTVPNNAVGFNVMIGDNSSSACEIWITEVKLEKGNTATNWSLAPQDTSVNQYITNIDNQRGITIKPVNSSGNDYLQINSTDIRFIRNNYAKTVITDSKITLYSGNATYPLVDISSSAIKIAQSATSYANVNSNGLQIYNGNKQVANFGEDARIGINDNNYSNIHITSDSMTISNKGVETYKIKNATNHIIRRVVSPHKGLDPSYGPTTYETYIPVSKNKTLVENQIGNGQIIITYHISGDDENHQTVTTTYIDTYTGLEQNVNKQNYYTFTSEIIREGEYEGAKVTDVSVNFTISSSFPTSQYFELESIEINYIVDEIVVENTIGAYANTGYSGPFKIGNGDSADSTSNALLVDYDNDVRVGGDVYIHCNEDSTGGMSLGTIKTFRQSYNISGFSELWIEAYQIGYVVTLTIDFHKTTSTAASGDYFSNLVVNDIPAPVNRDLKISAFGYAGGRPIGYWFAYYYSSSDDVFCWRINARNLSSSAASNIGATASMTYVTDGTLCGDVW